MTTGAHDAPHFWVVRLLCDLQDGPCKVIRVAVCGLGLSADRSLRAVGVRFRLLEPAICPLPCGLAGVGSIGHGRNAPPDRQGDRSVGFVALVCYYQSTFPAQVPSNVGIYSKLLGQHHMSVFMSILQVRKRSFLAIYI